MSQYIIYDNGVGCYWGKDRECVGRENAQIFRSLSAAKAAITRFFMGDEWKKWTYCRFRIIWAGGDCPSKMIGGAA